MRRWNVAALTLVGLMTFAVRLQAQALTEMRFLKPTSSLSGNTGLWKVHTPTGLELGQVSFSLWADRINRNPGQLTITTYGFGGAVGLTDWMELGLNFEVNRRILVRRADQLSLGQQQLGFFGTKVPGAAPLPSELMPGSSLLPQLREPATPTGALSRRAGYYNAFPFASKIQGNGVGTVAVGLKFKLLSEASDAPVDAGLRLYAHIPTHRSIAFLRERPSQSGGWIYGGDFLLGKNVSDMADVFFNFGLRSYQSPGDGRAVNLSNVAPIGFGITLPRDTRLQFMGEVTADWLFGDHTRNKVPDGESLADATVGFRAFVNRYLNLSAGYRRPLTQFGGDKNGFVFQIGYTYGPAMDVTPPSPPSLSCSASPTQVTVGQLVQLTASGSSSTGAPLTFAWTTNGGTIQGSGANVSVSTTGLAPGNYMATVRVSEPSGLYADCPARFTVVAPPMNPPTVSCSADRTNVQVGEAVNLTAQGNSPDGRPLTYQWTTTAGTLVGSGASVRLDTSGVSPGTITPRARATDDRGLSAECSVTITVTAPPPPPPPPQVTLLDTCQFAQNSARVDNVCKAKLDSIALRLQSEADATLAIVGFAASNERNAQQLSQSRADNVRAYLANERGIAQGRLTSRTGAPGTGAAARKAEMHLVPRGATFVGYNVELDRERVRAARPAGAAAAGRQTIASLR
ncbi:MAG TPA: OmpA family protein [Terriglobia bacterium]|nr:OmpA family protein [Terriglobia bacterium]